MDKQQEINWQTGIPESGIRIIVLLENGYITIARYYKKFTTEADTDYVDDSCYEYDEETDNFYMKEGFYEANIYDEMEYYIHEKVVYWMPLPKHPIEFKRK